MIVLGPEGPVNGAPGNDAALVMDISNPAKPRIRAGLPLANSLLGPPTNLQMTPDGKLGLIANSVVHVQDGNAWKPVPDNKLHVIDLDANPPKLIDTITVGRQPSGLSISRKGDLALIANRDGKSVSVVSIQGSTVSRPADRLRKISDWADRSGGSPSGGRSGLSRVPRCKQAAPAPSEGRGYYLPRPNA